MLINDELNTYINLDYITRTNNTNKTLILSDKQYECVTLVNCNASVCIYYNRGECIINFSTTNDFHDVIYDLTYFTTIQDGLQFHCGFFELTQKLYSLIDDFLTSTITTQNIVIVGHSLGGACSLIFTYLYTKNTERKIDKIITFGCPRVSLNSLEFLPCEQYNYVNSYDIVSYFPYNFIPNFNIIPLQSNLENYSNFFIFLRSLSVVPRILGGVVLLVYIIINQHRMVSYRNILNIKLEV